MPRLHQILKSIREAHSPRPIRDNDDLIDNWAEHGRGGIGRAGASNYDCVCNQTMSAKQQPPISTDHAVISGCHHIATSSSQLAAMCGVLVRASSRHAAPSLDYISPILQDPSATGSLARTRAGEDIAGVDVGVCVSTSAASCRLSHSPSSLIRCCITHNNPSKSRRQIAKRLVVNLSSLVQSQSTSLCRTMPTLNPSS